MIGECEGEKKALMFVVDGGEFVITFALFIDSLICIKSYMF